MLAVIVWICTLIICQCRVITINNSGGYNNTDCCRNGLCPCSNFSDALEHLKDNTTVNITSQLITLEYHVVMGSRNLNSVSETLKLDNIIILGNGGTIMCNNKGSTACVSCSNIIFEGIIWDRCANSKFTQGLTFVNVSNVTVSMCTFQHFNTCIGAAFLMASGFITVQKCQFLFNHVGNVSDFSAYAALLISTHDDHENVAYDISIFITETLFHHNGIFYDSKHRYSTINVWLLHRHAMHFYMDNSTVSENGGLGGNLALAYAAEISLGLREVKFMSNNYGGLQNTISSFAERSVVLIYSSTFAHNTNGSLKLTITPTSLLGGYSLVELNNVTVNGNKGTFSEDMYADAKSISQGTGILLQLVSLNVYVNISYCNILNNVGSDSSAVYIEDRIGGSLLSKPNIAIVSSNFSSNHGPALHFSNCNVELIGNLSFSNNTAQSGSAIYLAHDSQVLIGINSTIEFTNNIALLFGGAFYVDLPFNCAYQGATFTHLPNNSLVIFTNNTAGISGNSLYFNIPESCNVIMDYSDNHSIVYIPYQFTYMQLPGSVLSEISTSPYAVNLCSAECSSTSNKCFIGNRNMLGHSIYFNATVCDYFNNISESVQFLMKCVDCNNNYRLSDSKILAYNGVSEFKIFTVNADNDISTNRNVTINMTSISSHGYKQLSAAISIELSPCHSGYVFVTDLQQCKCYDQDQDIIQCQEDNIGIKYGHWFGIVTSDIRTYSLCPTFYCTFDDQAEIRDGYFKLPEQPNDQCSSHRAGMACGECKPGYTLAYDSPDCINRNECSPGITTLVVLFTILYWIAIVVVVFGLMYLKFNLSLGYVYGILFYYSVVDILLGSNLYISVGVFQLTTILSSFSKLTPQFLGRFCFVEGLSGIDQQFIHYTHALAVFILTIAIVIAARWSMKIASIVSCCIIRVICLLLLLAYTSLASTSLKLLRPLYYHDIDGPYVYLSPSIKYFTDQHVAYGIVACVCGLFIVIGFPLLLLLQPFLRSKVNCIKIKPLLDQFQGCYKDQYHWFAAYYLICRLIIIGIAFTSNFNNALYYLQTVSIIIVMIHVWIQPYKSDMLNILDGITLLIMILIINLSSYAFIRSTTIAIAIILVTFPLVLSFATFLYFTIFSNWIQHRKNGRIREASLRYAMA